MKLAEALSIRKDLQKRIQQIGRSLEDNVKVQEGEQPAEQPEELLKELDECLKKLEDLVLRINLTNVKTINEAGKTLTQLMAEKDILTLRISTLRSTYERASAQRDRYSRSEIKMLTTINVKQLRKQIDDYSVQLRKLDMEIQSMNFQTELV
jgi:hypothetical protein